jgi:hypothetical protein
MLDACNVSRAIAHDAVRHALETLSVPSFAVDAVPA